MMFNCDLLSKYMVHYVTDESYGMYANIHTHGLEESYDHKDIQMVLGLPPDQAAMIMNICVDKIDKGVRLEPGITYSDIFPFRDVEFIEKIEDDRILLRMLVHDENYMSPLDPDCEILYSGQLTFDPEAL